MATIAASSVVDRLNAIVAAADEHEPVELEDAYRRALRDMGRSAAASFRSRTALTAAADWNPPLVDEVVPGRPPPAAAQAAAAARAALLAELLIAWDVPGLLTQQLLDQLAVRADRIAVGIREPVARAIARSYVEGLSVEQTADAILAAVDDVAEWQARMLARTDLVALGNGGSSIAARSLTAIGGPELYQRWLTARDERVRPTHVNAEGQTVPVDTPFVVGDALLRYPGDPEGPDGEILNCRCTVIYVEADALQAAGERIYHRWPRGTPIDPTGRGGGRFAPEERAISEPQPNRESRHHVGGGLTISTLKPGDRFYFGGILYQLDGFGPGGAALVTAVDSGEIGEIQAPWTLKTQPPGVTPPPPIPPAPPPPAADELVEVTGRSLKPGDTFWARKRIGTGQYELRGYKVVGEPGAGYIRIVELGVGKQMLMKRSAKVQVLAADFPAAAKRAARESVNHVTGELDKVFSQSPGPRSQVTKAAIASSEQIGRLVALPDGLPKMPLKETRSMTMGGKFSYKLPAMQGAAVPDSISLRAVDEELPEIVNNANHEVAHYLDTIALGDGRYDASVLKDVDKAGPLMEAINNSRASVRIDSMIGSTGGTYGVVTNPGTAYERRFPVDREHLRYLQKPTEKFARAFEQYVATRAGTDDQRTRYLKHSALPDDDVTLDEGESSQGFYGWYWEPEDFEPIAREFDAMFRRLGWSKS